MGLIISTKTKVVQLYLIPIHLKNKMNTDKKIETKWYLHQNTKSPFQHHHLRLGISCESFFEKNISNKAAATKNKNARFNENK